jgi:hypothetical protein
MQYGKNGLSDAALQASQIHVPVQVLVFGNDCITMSNGLIIISDSTSYAKTYYANQA